MEKRTARSFSATLLGVIILFVFSKIISRKSHIKTYNQAKLIKPFDAIIVPGVPFWGDKWDSVMKARVLWSYHLFKNGFAKNIIYSGGAVHSPYVESIIMGEYAKALGIPETNIFCDIHARHSTENIFYSYLLAKKSGFKTLALATDPFQSFFLKRFIKRHFGTHIYRLPLIPQWLEQYNNTDPRIDTAPAITSSFTLETFWQRMRGTLGLNIQWNNYKNEKLSPL